VPKVTGRRLAAAKRAIKQAGCAVGKVSAKKAKGKKGVVLAQSPKAGATKPARTKVKLVVRR
jgi:beta-lactam-binding protein with PASTA domain